MKRSRFVWSAIFTLLLLSLSFSQISRQKPVALQRGATKIDQLLQQVERAASLAEVKAAVAKAGLTPAEINELKSDPRASQRYKQSMDRIIRQTQASLQPKMAASRQRMEAAAAQAQTTQLAGGGRPARGMPGVIRPPAQCPPPGPLRIIKLDPTLHPGRDFEISGTGFGDTPGTVRVTLPAALKSFETPAVSSWKDCSVIARLSSDLPPLDDPGSRLVLTTRDGQRTGQPVQIKRETIFITLSDGGMCIGPGALWPLGDVDPNAVTNCDKVDFDFPLINGYYVHKVDFEAVPMIGDTSAVIELASSPPLNTPNCSARASVRVRMPPYTAGAWALSVVLAGPRGLPYKN